MASVEPTKFTWSTRRKSDGTTERKKLASRDSKWVARWRTPDGASREKVFDRKADAEQHLTSVEHSKLSGAYVDPRAGRITFKTYAEQWRASQVHRAGTASQIETNLRRHVYPRIGNKPIGAIRRSDIQSAIKAMSVGSDQQKALSPATIEVVYTWTATIFKSAVLDRVIPSSPCHEIDLPAVEERRIVPLAEETVGALIETVPERYRALIVLGAGTGLRISEALGLTNDRIDWLRRTITIDRQLLRVAGAEPEFGPVKDKRNRPRTVPLPQTVVDELSAHVARFGLGPEGVIFTSPRGGPVRRATFSDMWLAAAGPLGVPSGDGFHQLRHFYASVLIRAGESVKVVQERLGHTSATMTLDVYGHLWPEDEDRTRQAVDAVLGPLKASDRSPVAPQIPHTTAENAGN